MARAPSLLAAVASVVAASCSGTASASSSSPPDPRALLAQLTLKQKIGQLTQIVGSDLTVDGTTLLDPAKLAVLVDTYGVGSFLGPITGCETDPVGQPRSSTSFAAWRNFTSSLQAYVLTHQGNVTPPIPMLYGIDSVHGANFLDNAAWFQHAFGLAASFRPTLARKIAAVATLDTRAMGAAWVFAPILGLAINPLWSRFYETFGEDPFVGQQFGAAFVLGTQDAGASLAGGGVNYTLASPSMKHFMGYSFTRTGKDRTDAWLPDAYLKQYAQPAFAAAITATNFKAASVMVNSASINGVPAHASAALLTDLLRVELGCAGCVALTDWQDILKLHDYHNVAASPADAIVMGLAAGLDMSMVPSLSSPLGNPFFADVLLSLVQNGTVSESRVDESVLRVLQLKIDLGLFEAPTWPPQLDGRVPGNADDIALADEVVRESLTLLKNGPAPAGRTGSSNVLPLPAWLPAGATILVVGPASVDLAALCGGWSLGLPPGGNGACGSPTPFLSASIANRTALAASALGFTVISMQGANFTSSDPAQLALVTAAAQKADVVVLAVGEAPEKETAGDTEDLTLHPAQMALFAALNATSTPLVTVLVEPRPRILGALADGSSAILMAYLPCISGAQGIADVLLGASNPSGRLPFTYPRTSGDLDVYFHKRWENSVAYEGVPSVVYHNPLFDFGWGLGYSPLAYSGLVLSPASVPAGGIVNVSVTVTNMGEMDANETTLVFVAQLFRAAISPEDRLLKGFAKTLVPKGQSVTVSVLVDTHELSYWNPALERVIDAGVYNVTVGGLAAPLTLTSSGRFVADGKNKGRPLRLEVEGEEEEEDMRKGGEAEDDFFVEELLEAALWGVADGANKAGSGYGGVAAEVRRAEARERLRAVVKARGRRE